MLILLTVLCWTVTVDESARPLLHFLCGINAGVLASVLTQPADVVKTHMQLNPKKHAKVFETVQFVYEVRMVLSFYGK